MVVEMVVVYFWCIFFFVGIGVMVVQVLVFFQCDFVEIFDGMWYYWWLVVEGVGDFFLFVWFVVDEFFCFWC